MVTPIILKRVMLFISFLFCTANVNKHQTEDLQSVFPHREGGRCAEMAMVCLTDFEEYAKEHLSKATWDYYAAGADECCTRDDNLLAYKRYSGENNAQGHRKYTTVAQR